MMGKEEERRWAGSREEEEEGMHRRCLDRADILLESGDDDLHRRAAAIRVDGDRRVTGQSRLNGGRMMGVEPRRRGRRCARYGCF
jgi:hypothetical protein